MMAYTNIDEINELRLYLRHNYYKNVGSDISALFAHDKNFILDAAYDGGDNQAVMLKLKHHNTPMTSLMLYNYIDGVLLALYNTDSIDRLIFLDNNLKPEQKEKYLKLHSTLPYTPSLLRYMYSVIIPVQSTAIVYL